MRINYEHKFDVELTDNIISICTFGSQKRSQYTKHVKILDL